eukprot:gene27670-34422_t
MSHSNAAVKPQSNYLCLYSSEGEEFSVLVGVKNFSYLKSEGKKVIDGKFGSGPFGIFNNPGQHVFPGGKSNPDMLSNKMKKNIEKGLTASDELNKVVVLKVGTYQDRKMHSKYAKFLEQYHDLLTTSKDHAQWKIAFDDIENADFLTNFPAKCTKSLETEKMGVIAENIISVHEQIGTSTGEPDSGYQAHSSVAAARDHVFQKASASAEAEEGAPEGEKQTSTTDEVNTSTEEVVEEEIVVPVAPPAKKNVQQLVAPLKSNRSI